MALSAALKSSTSISTTTVLHQSEPILAFCYISLPIKDTRYLTYWIGTLDKVAIVFQHKFDLAIAEGAHLR